MMQKKKSNLETSWGYVLKTNECTAIASSISDCYERRIKSWDVVNDNIVIIQQRIGITWKLSKAHAFCKIIYIFFFFLLEVFCQYSLKRGVPSATAGAAPAESRAVLSAQDAPGSDLDPLISEQRHRRLQEQLQRGQRANTPLAHNPSLFCWKRAQKHRAKGHRWALH